jgi:hypothetical protein
MSGLCVHLHKSCIFITTGALGNNDHGPSIGFSDTTVVIGSYQHISPAELIIGRTYCYPFVNSRFYIHLENRSTMRAACANQTRLALRPVRVKEDSTSSFIHQRQLAYRHGGPPLAPVHYRAVLDRSRIHHRRSPCRDRAIACAARVAIGAGRRVQK